MPWPYEQPRKPDQPAIPRERVTSSRQRVLAKRKPSQFPFNFCELDGCGSYEGVYYDPEMKLHLCATHFMNTPRPKAAKVTASQSQSDDTPDFGET